MAALIGASWRQRGRPAYRALADAICLLVLDGRLPLSIQLPAERELALALCVSRTTVTAAYGQLRADGYLHSRRGSGSVSALAPSRPTARAVGWAPPPDGEAIDLALAALPAPEPALARAADAAVHRLYSHAQGHGYDTAGLRELREAIAERYQQRGLDTSAEQVLITSGAQHALVLVLRLLARPGERVLVECPTFPGALTAIDAAGCRTVPVAIDGHGWAVDLLTDAIRQTAPVACYLIPDFHNPTGQLMDDHTRAAVVRAAAYAGSYVLIDETFAELAFARPPTPTARFDRDDRVITIGSLSKSHWGGLRVGWIRASEPLVRRLADCRAGLDLAQPVLDQLVAVELLADPRLLPERRALLRHRRDLLAAALRERLPGWRFELPNGGLALWVDLGAPVSSALTLAAARHGVVIAAGPRFGAAASLERHLRVPFAAAEPQLREAVERLARALPEALRHGGPIAAPTIA